MKEPQKKYLTTRERICFTVGAFGRSGIYTLMSMFTLVFFQNGAGLSLSQGTTIILIGRIFDALNDPVMGMIVDRTKSKWGKMRPYLLFAPVPIAVCTILLFTAPFKWVPPPLLCGRWSPTFCGAWPLPYRMCLSGACPL